MPDVYSRKVVDDRLTAHNRRATLRLLDQASKRVSRRAFLEGVRDGAVVALAFLAKAVLAGLTLAWITLNLGA